jgi:hypothetical protein
MIEASKNFLHDDGDEAFLAAYRIARARELLEHVRWKQTPPAGALFDYKGNLVSLPDIPEQTYWKMFFAGTAQKLDEDDEVMLKRVEGKMGKGAPITPLDIHNLEQAYCKLSAWAVLTEEQEERLRGFIRKTAEEDVAAGTFKTLELALRHYGERGEAEEKNNG